MKGEFLKAQLLKIEPTIARVAEKLDVSKQSMHQSLESIDVKTGLVEKLSELYGLPIGFFFGETTSNKSLIQSRLVSDEHDELIRLREEVKYLRSMVEHKNAALEEKSKWLNQFLNKSNNANTPND